jgi:hypothetical protein
VAFQKQFNLPQTPVKIIGINKPDKGYLAEAALDIEWMCSFLVFQNPFNALHSHFSFPPFRPSRRVSEYSHLGVLIRSI